MDGAAPGTATTAQSHRDGAACLSVLLLRSLGRLKGDLNLPREENEPAPFTQLAPTFTGGGTEFFLALRKRS